LKMTDELRDKFGYADLTPEIKDQIFGLNAAKLFELDPKAKREAVQNDRFSKLRREYDRNPAPTNTQYGWVWVEDGHEPTTPVGAG
jgi:hypothetical protein